MRAALLILFFVPLVTVARQVPLDPPRFRRTHHSSSKHVAKSEGKVKNPIIAALARPIITQAVKQIVKSTIKKFIKKAIVRYTTKAGLKIVVRNALIKAAIKKTLKAGTKFKGKLDSIKFSEMDRKGVSTCVLKQEARIERVAKTAGLAFVDSQMKFSGWDLVPIVGEVRLIKQIKTVVFSGKTKKVVQAALENEIEVAARKCIQARLKMKIENMARAVDNSDTPTNDKDDDDKTPSTVDKAGDDNDDEADNSPTSLKQDYGKCRKGVSGTCIDIRRDSCSKKTRRGLCPGSRNIRCCPE